VSGSPGCTAAAAVVTCAIGDLAVNGTSTVTITALAAGNAVGQILTNTASASSSTPDPIASNNDDTASIAVRPPIADLSLTKTATPTTIAPGDTVTFTLALENNGPDPAQATTVTDTLPAGLTFVSASTGCTGSGNVVSCALGTLPTEATSTITITAQATSSGAGQTLTNAAAVSSSTPDPIARNNTDTAAVAVTALPPPPPTTSPPPPTTSPPQPTTSPAPAPVPAPPSVTIPQQSDLAVRKTVSPSTLTAGGLGTYTIVVSNKGPSDAAAVALTDPMPTGLTAISAKPSQGTCTIAADGGVACRLGTISSGGAARVVIVARVDASMAGETLTNSVKVTSTTPDPDRRNNTATRSSRVSQAAGAGDEIDLSVHITAREHLVRTGGLIHYAITASNLSDTPAHNVRITSTLSEPAAFVSARIGRPRILADSERLAKAGQCSRGTSLSCTIGSVPPHATVTIELVVRPLTSRTLLNTVKIRGKEKDVRLRNNLDTVETRVLAARAIKPKPPAPSKPAPAAANKPVPSPTPPPFTG
jgi:large repetitive protein